MIFDELVLGEEFKAFGRNWRKKSQFGALCLDRDSPYNPECVIAFDRKAKVELKSLRKDDPNSIFKRRTK